MTGGESALGRSTATRFGVAAGCFVLAVLARIALDPYLGEQQPYFTFFVAVAAVSWFAGSVPALLTAILGYLTAEWLFAGAHHIVMPSTVGDAIGQASYFMVSLAIVLFGHLMQKAQLRALSRQSELEREIAERKRAEEALRESREDLDRAQAVAHTGSWRMDTQRNVLLWSGENHRIFGIPEGTPLTYESFLGVVHPDDRDFVDRSWRAGLRGEPYDIEHRIIADGAVRWLRERAELEFDKEGALLGGFGTTQDITERKEIEQELARRARLKDEFLALLGHELRNPLAAISTAVHLLAGGVAPARRAFLHQMMERQLAVLQRLVDDLLDFTRITHGQIKLKEKCIDLGEFLQTAASAAGSYVASCGHELVLRLPSERVQFMADEVRLEQVIANLLDNAAKYTDRGGRIELSGAREASEVVIRCKDNGRGIPWGMNEMIFEPFTRAERAGESAEAGVGVGMALVKHLVELHGGTVRAESGGPGAGSEFVVRLPLVEPPPAGRRERSARNSRSPLSVAVVEDNPDVAQSLEILLEQAGHRVTLFEDGLSALSGLARLKPAVVLLDIGLPGMDGYELAAGLRKEPALEHALLIAISGFNSREEAGNAQGDFDHYLVKPVEPAKLLACLETRARAAEAG